MVGQNQQLKQLACQSKITWYTVKAICNAYETKIVMITIEEKYKCEVKKKTYFSPKFIIEATPWFENIK